MGTGRVPVGREAALVAWSQEALSIPGQEHREGFPAWGLPARVASSIQGRDLGMIPFGLLEPPQAKRPDTADSQVKLGQLLP